LDEIELNLMTMRDKAKGELEALTERENELYEELSRVLARKVTNLNDALSTLKGQLKNNHLPELDSFDKITEYCESTLQSSVLWSINEKAGTFSKIRGLVEKSPFSGDLEEKIKAFNLNFNRFKKDKYTVKTEYIELLSAGRSLIADERRNTCPLCEQQIDTHTVLGAIEKRIGTLVGLSTLAGNLRTALSNIINALSEIKSELETVKTQLRGTDFTSEEEQLERALKDFNSLTKLLKKTEAFKKELPYDMYRTLSRSIEDLFAGISSKCNRKLAELELSARKSKMISSATLLGQIKNIIDRIDENSEELSKMNARYTLVNRLFTTFSETKKQKVQETYDAIRKDIQKYYTKLHPTDNPTNIDLSVELGRRASTTIKINVFGKKEDPRALSSEGHLDSLGLCIFLAFINKFNRACSLLILDDVVTTIDNHHREKICDLLFSDFCNRQMIITTHDEVWCEQLRNYQRTYGIDGNFKNLTITNWDLAQGPVIVPYKPRWGRIQDKIKNGDKSAGNEGRHYLEWLLDKLCDVTKAPVPYNSSKRYEVWELLPSVEARLKKLINDVKYLSEVNSVFMELRKTLPMGNLLSHYSLLLDQISITEVRHFCEAVYNIHNKFLCPSCGTFVSYYSKLKELRCDNDKCTNQLRIKTN